MARKPRPPVGEKRLFTEFPGAWVRLPGTRTYELPIGYGNVQVTFGKNASGTLSFLGGVQKLKSREDLFWALPGAVASKAMGPTTIGMAPAQVPEWAQGQLKAFVKHRTAMRLSDQARLFEHLQNINLELQGLSRG